MENLDEVDGLRVQNAIKIKKEKEEEVLRVDKAERKEAYTYYKSQLLYIWYLFSGFTLVGIGLIVFVKIMKSAWNLII